MPKNSNRAKKPPVRLCCGKRHYGVLCPDQKVMCCICFERVSLVELHENAAGQKENICLKCADRVYVRG